MRHASERELALYAGGDLGLWDRLRCGRHVAICALCRQRVEALRAAKEQLRRAASEWPLDADWDRLAREMAANIRLGLAAGEIVTPAAAPAHLTGWRPAIVFASALFVVLLAWWVNHRNPVVPSWPMAGQPRAAQGVLVEGNASGVGLNDHGRVFTLRHPNDQDVAFSVNLEGVVRARYVDSESGQVTINNVYVP